MTDKTTALAEKILEAWLNSDQHYVRSAGDMIGLHVLEPMATEAAETAIRDRALDTLREVDFPDKPDEVPASTRPATNQEASRESLVRAIEDLHRVIRKRNDEISALRMECRDLAAELAEAKPADAIVIPKSDLPEVHAIGGSTHWIDGSVYTSTPSPQWCRAEARRLLALAEHIDANVERPAACCGKCPPIAGGGYDCTCEGNPRCGKQVTA